MSNHRYRLTYDVQPQPKGLLKEEVPKGKSAADAIMMASIIYPEDGSLSVLFISRDGRPEAAPSHELAPHEIFKIWGMLASRLANNPALAAGQRALCESVWNVICEVVRGQKAEAEEPGSVH